MQQLGGNVDLKRLTPNPCICVSDLMKPLHAFHKQGDAESDVSKRIVPKDERSITWKTAPNASWLASIASLLDGYLRITPDAIISSKKHKIAIMKLCE